MTEYDAQVAEWAEAKVVELRVLGVAQLLRQTVGRTWRRNADGYDPNAGDTARSLGVTQSENLRELMLREYHDHQELWRTRGVTVSAPEQSLLVNAAGLALHPMKARTNTEQDPQWDAMRWSERSLVRRTAARENRAGYVPAFATPFPGMETMGQNPDVLGHTMVVYRGDLATGRTAGWFAVPSADEAGQESNHPWMAVTALWRDEGDAGRAARPEGGDPASLTRFDTRPAPEAPVTLKPARRPSAS
ncbi:MAG: hypothetical protein L0H64_10775 [Pseudonocardia sp.]|nr:hypothetical protein [Pseudonocardia sp.]